uniref:Ovule protein n=1 Tax=Steinernema glaseri TaxID=37863 RepID=A0A1I7YUW0_9BILA
MCKQCDSSSPPKKQFQHSIPTPPATSKEERKSLSEKNPEEEDTRARCYLIIVFNKIDQYVRTKIVFASLVT